MIKHVRVVSRKQATGLVAEVYDQVERDFGKLVDPYLAHSEVPSLLASYWCVMREAFLTGEESRAYKEAIAALVSRANECPYCVDAHRVMLNAAHRPEVADAIGVSREGEIADRELRDVMAWAAATRSPDSPKVLQPPFAMSERPELIGTAVAFHYTNRIVSILFSHKSPLPPPFRRLELLRNVAFKVGGKQFAKAVNARRPTGDALKLVADAPLPDDLGWAARKQHVRGAFARFAAAVDAGAAGLVDGETRELVETRVGAWRGEVMSLGRGWVDSAAGSLSVGVRPVARFALLAALAPHQIDQAIIDAFKQARPEEGALLRVLAWAAFTAARRVGYWLWKGAIALEPVPTSGPAPAERTHLH